MGASRYEAHIRHGCDDEVEGAEIFVLSAENPWDEVITIGAGERRCHNKSVLVSGVVQMKDVGGVGERSGGCGEFVLLLLITLELEDASRGCISQPSRI